MGPHVCAQQLPIFFTNRDNALLVNPASPIVPTILENSFDPLEDIRFYGGLTYRHQWAAFQENSPRTYTGKLNYKLIRGLSDLWGSVYFISDQTGPSSLNGVYTNVTVSRFLGNGQYLRAGISLGALQYKLDESKLITRSPDDPTLAEARETGIFPGIGIGVFYSSRSFYGGLSLPQTLKLSTNQVRSLQTHTYATVGTYLRPNAGVVDFIELSAWMRYAAEFAPLIDGDVKVRFQAGNNTSPFWVGGGIDNNLSWRAEAGFIADSNARNTTNNYLHKISFLYGRRIGQGIALGSTFEISYNLMK